MKRSPVISVLLAVLGLCALSAEAAGGKQSLGPRAIAPPSPVWIIASYDSAGSPNMMTASWAGVCCSRPPCVAVSLREATYTYHCIMTREAFTVNIPSTDHAAVAAYVGTVSGRDTDKFDDTGLTAVRSDLVDAPYLGECPLVLECRLVRTVELGLHTMFIGEIVDVKADEEILGENGTPDPARHRPFVFSVGGYGFYEVGAPIGAVPELAKRYMEEE
jgi:flavin reductase (DIM6/NTAB) family NADH-FMN oxidoreductase RutF